MNNLLRGLRAFLWLLTPLALGLLLNAATPSYTNAQGWGVIINMPQTDMLVIANYVGIDQKMKPVAGQSITIQAPTATTTDQVYVEAHVVGANILGLDKCNGEIAWARTKDFAVTGSKTLGASDFASSGGVGIEDSGPDPNPCLDDLVKKVSEGVGTAPQGRYTLTIRVFKKSTKALLAQADNVIEIIASSAREVNLNLISPANGEQISSSNPTFQFDAQKEGKIYVYEHSNPGQSSEDAVRPGGLKCLELAYNLKGTNQVNYLYPGNALRPLQLGKKYSWFIEASLATGGGQSETRTSTVYSFTVSSNDPNYTRLLDALTNAPDPIGSTVSNLLSSGYTLAYSTSNYIKLKAGTSSTRLEISDLLQKLAELTQRGIQVTVSVGTE